MFRNGVLRHETRVRQRHFYDEECDPEFEIARPHNCGRLYQFLIEEKFRTGIRMLGLELAGKSVLEVCCGSGMISEKFARAGAMVTGLDFSSAAIARAQERARRYGFEANFRVGDAENLAFEDRSFDIVAVHDGLHHLNDPARAVREMARVARSGVMVLDPARAAITRLAVRLKVSVDVEEAGNEVKRVVPSEVARILREAGYDRIRWRRTLMYYPHRPWGWWRFFDYAAPFMAFRAAFWCTDLAFARFGNKLALAARRE
jgi:2-polyprenyl-3-methyl-5-hydroxy-6-metoxy-1,4-benzoquinol methylase